RDAVVQDAGGDVSHLARQRWRLLGRRIDQRVQKPIARERRARRMPALRGVRQTLLNADALENAALENLRKHEQSPHFAQMAEIGGRPIDRRVSLRVARLEREGRGLAISREADYTLLRVRGLGRIAR